MKTSEAFKNDARVLVLGLFMKEHETVGFMKEHVPGRNLRGTSYTPPDQFYPGTLPPDTWGTEGIQ